jgi:hypothetical protein
MADCESRSNPLLEKEFEHASRLVLAARRERSRAVAVYLLLAGGTGALTAVAPSFVLARPADVAAAANPVWFFSLALVGVFTLIRLARTRHAEWGGLQVMAQIRDHYAGEPEIAGVLRPSSEPTPAPGRAWSVAFDQVLLVVLLDSGAFGIAAHASGLRVPLGEYVVGVFAGVVFLAWQVLYYMYQLPVEA